MAEDIVKLLCRPGSPIILVFDPKHQNTVPRGTSSAETQNTRGWENFCSFRLKSPFISNTVQDRPMIAMER